MFYDVLCSAIWGQFFFGYLQTIGCLTSQWAQVLSVVYADVQ